MPPTFVLICARLPLIERVSVVSASILTDMLATESCIRAMSPDMLLMAVSMI